MGDIAYLMQGFYAYPCHTRTSYRWVKNNNLYILNGGIGECLGTETFLFLMFSENELKSYEEFFIQIGITSQQEQKQVLDFMYSMGTIIYNNRV